MLRALLYSVILLCCTATPLAAEEAFTIDNIHITKTAADASTARKEAIKAAELAAFEQLMHIILQPDTKEQLEELDPDTISTLVQSFEVTQEQITRNTYQANFSISFNPSAIKSVLRQDKLDVILDKSPPLLVLPILQQEEKVVLWEASNPWRNAWDALALESKIVPLILPIGDLEDIQMVSVEDAYSHEYSALDRLAKKYSAESTLILEGTYRLDGITEEPTLEVVMRSIDHGIEIDRKKGIFKGEKSQPVSEFYASVVRKVINRLEGEWRKDIRQAVEKNRTQPARHITVMTPISGINEWLELKQRIEEFELVDSYEIKELSVSKVALDIYYKGDFATFAYFLHTRGFQLSRDGEVIWMVARG